MGIVGDAPLFDSSLLLAGSVDTSDVRRQLTRWTRTGKLMRLRRGLYALAPPFRRLAPEPFVVANRLHAPSYVSGASALAFYGLLPEAVVTTVSVTTRRTASYATPLGHFRFHHIARAYFVGYESVRLSPAQVAFVATPEKAVLDHAYFEPGGDSEAYLAGLRLQNLDFLDLTRLQRLAERIGTPKARRTARRVATIASREGEEYRAP